MYVVYSSFRFHYPLSSLPVNFALFVFFAEITPIGRSKRDIANNHTAQHRAITSAQVALGTIKSLVVPNHGPLIIDSSIFS